MADPKKEVKTQYILQCHRLCKRYRKSKKPVMKGQAFCASSHMKRPGQVSLCESRPTNGGLGRVEWAVKWEWLVVGFFLRWHKMLFNMIHGTRCAIFWGYSKPLCVFIYSFIFILRDTLENPSVGSFPKLPSLSHRVRNSMQISQGRSSNPVPPAIVAAPHVCGRGKVEHTLGLEFEPRPWMWAVGILTNVLLGLHLHGIFFFKAKVAINTVKLTRWYFPKYIYTYFTVVSPSLEANPTPWEDFF